MRTAYFDCASGVSGDMILGALVDCGLPLSKLSRGLKPLPIDGWSLQSEFVQRATLTAKKVTVIVNRPQRTRLGLGDITRIITKAAFPPIITKRSLEVFSRIAKAEAEVHGQSPQTVRFHEIGVVDTMIDVVGTLLGLAYLEIDDVVVSPLNMGSGTVNTSHGRLPIPVPVTAKLLVNTPVYTSDINAELTTPTGAALVTSLARRFGPMPEMIMRTVGYGAGTAQFPDQPNVLRIFIGERAGDKRARNNQPAGNGTFMVETNLDDMNPQVYDYLIDRLLTAGALDVTLTPVIMKRGRPAIVLGVLSTAANLDHVIHTIFRETTTLGVRFHEVVRRVLHREARTIDTRYGKVAVKVSRMGREMHRASPEFRDCRRIAEKTGRPLREVMDVVRQAIDRAGL